MNLVRQRLMLLAVLLAACAPASAPQPVSRPDATSSAQVSPTPIPVRTIFPPGQVFDYLAQPGDTLPAIASHFSTTEAEIRAENPGLPDPMTTLPAGFLVRVPAYYRPLTSSAFHIVPDSEAVNGPGAIDVDLKHEVEGRPGYLNKMTDYAQRRQRPAWDVINVAAQNYSIHPRIFLALLEYRTGALTNPFPDEIAKTYPLGHPDPRYRGLYRQLIWAAEAFNDAYYSWRSGLPVEFELTDGKVAHPDPWQNAGTVGLEAVLAGLYGQEDFEAAIGPDGLAATWRRLWGDPFADEGITIPASLQQPELGLPFPPNRVWDFTGGPHMSWGDAQPYGALDFAPPAVIGGCAPSTEWFTAPADGVIARSGDASVLLDLDGDGDERTGWVLLFFHVATEGRIAAGSVVQRGDPLGHPSCEGGIATGTHFHMARRYNGEWIPAGGVIPFDLDGWVAANGAAAYQGTLTRGSKTIQACTCTTANNRILYELPSPDD